MKRFEFLRSLCAAMFTTSLAVAALTWAGAAVANPSITNLGTLPGGNSSAAYAVSSNGSVVVGDSYSTSVGTRAFRWTSAGGMQDLGTLPGDAQVASHDR